MCEKADPLQICIVEEWRRETADAVTVSPLIEIITTLQRFQNANMFGK